MSVALVSGGSRGIGAAIAARLEKDGFTVVISHSGDADITDAAAVRDLFDRTGEVDVLVACAGAQAPHTTIGAMSEQDYARVVGVNLNGTFHLLREASRRLRDGGAIVTLSSSAVALGVPGQAVYNACKAAVEVLTAQLAKELAGRDITANTVAPGPTATELLLRRANEDTIAGLARQTPLGRIGSAEDVADVVSFLVGPGGRWVNGQTIRVNGGLV